MKEKPGFREQLARLDEQFPGKEALKIKEVIAITGICRETLLAAQDLPLKKMGVERGTGGVYIISKVALARWLA